MKESFKRLAKEIGVKLDDIMIENFFIYKDLLKEWNEKVNLTAITEENEIILKHFIDSLTIEKYIPQNASVIDVGTGAGFPGIPLKITRGDVKLTLLDSLQKRLLFLEDVKKKLNLKNVNMIHGRAEDIGKNKENREIYDIATARAVANLSVLAEYCLPFVKVGGYFICMKGNNVAEVEEAINAVEKLGGIIEKKEKFSLPNSNIERNIVLIKKIKNTPKEYPRKAGIPNKNPIK